VCSATPEILTVKRRTPPHVYALENEIQQLKKWRDEHFTSAIALVEKIKLGLVKLPE